MLVSPAPIDVWLIPGVLACEPRDQPHRRPEPIFSRQKRQIHLAEVVGAQLTLAGAELPVRAHPVARRPSARHLAELTSGDPR